MTYSGNKMTDVSIIGAGRLGACLGFALSRRGYKVKAVSCLTLAEAKESAKLLVGSNASTDNARTAEQGTVVFLCLPDNKIPRVASELARAKVDWSKKVVFHCSGLLPARVLTPLEKKGASIGSLHPALPFAQKKPEPGQFQGVFFGLEGDKNSLATARKMVRALGGHAFILQEKDKAAYHAGCSIASNYLVVLLESAVLVLMKTGLSEEQATQILFPLAKRTLQNVKDLGVEASLTGPIVRGDGETIKEHFKALKELPPVLDLYSRLGARALRIAQKRKLPLGTVRALKRLLEGK
jgi:predicted short-subunit dehydrogenase-like oxidoreductase (DUF2520 family)